VEVEERGFALRSHPDDDDDVYLKRLQRGCHKI
jgi:hypothetical protein